MHTRFSRYLFLPARHTVVYGRRNFLPPLTEECYVVSRESKLAVSQVHNLWKRKTSTFLVPSYHAQGVMPEKVSQ
jgi:hypothetical protein